MDGGRDRPGSLTDKQINLGFSQLLRRFQRTDFGSNNGFGVGFLTWLWLSRYNINDATQFMDYGWT